MFRSRMNWVPILGIIIVLFIAGSFFIIDLKLKSSLLQIAKSKAQTSGVEAINRIVNREIVSQVKYEDIVCVHKDNDGRIVLVQPNTIVLNKIMAVTVTEISDSMGKMQEDTIVIPLGELSGVKFLAGYGPKMKVKIIPAGEVHVDVLNKFEQAGINQTRHLIYFKVESKMKVAVPFLNDEVKVAAVIPLAETIIVGDVPQTYVNFRGQDDVLYPFIKNN